jgi:glycerol-3-phosphate dehydrogenase (NAD(P)+)
VTRCAVIGAGAWGTALAEVLARNGHETMLWAREDDVSESINAAHENRRFLAGAKLTPTLRASSTLAHVLDTDPELLVFAPPSQVLRSIARETRRLARGSPVAVIASKGIELETFALMTTIVEQEMSSSTVVALSGPSFAAEVAARQPTAVVAASDSADAAVVTQQAFSAPEFRVYTHDDVIGVELGGALKNVMAVATGICEGLGLGFNSRAALITRGLAEMTRLGTRLGARPETFAGLAGIGDLVLTCTGSLSRNRALGAEIGQGRTLEEALAGKETVAEGVITTRSAYALAQREGVEMPIIEAVYRTLFEGQPARQSITALMARELRPEQD